MRVLVMTNCGLFSNYLRDQAWFFAIMIWLLSNVADCSPKYYEFVGGAVI
jgi:hypothetical protein